MTMNGKNPDTCTCTHALLALLLLFFMVLRPGWGHCAEFILLYSNDNRGETEPCG